MRSYGKNIWLVQKKNSGMNVHLKYSSSVRLIFIIIQAWALKSSSSLVLLACCIWWRPCQYLNRKTNLKIKRQVVLNKKRIRNMFTYHLIMKMIRTNRFIINHSTNWKWNRLFLLLIKFWPCSLLSSVFINSNVSCMS